MMALGSGQLVGQLGSLTAVAQLTVAEVRYSYSSQVVDHKQVTAKGTGPLFFSIFRLWFSDSLHIRLPYIQVYTDSYSF